MIVTRREFRIAAAASLFGFLFCYFLAGQAMPPRSTSKMTVIYSLPNTPAATNQFPPQFHLPSVRTKALPPAVFPPYGAYGHKDRPELLGQPQRPRVDLTSSRYRAEVNLADLY